ncbi:MAG: hypothetical protein ABSE53_10520 [Terracidiphilus sp.]|jgi:hypothetical protein
MHTLYNRIQGRNPDRLAALGDGIFLIVGTGKRPIAIFFPESRLAVQRPV